MAARAIRPSGSSELEPALLPKIRRLFWEDDGEWIYSPYKVMHGGRGGLKSWGFATAAVILAASRKQKPLRIACAREYQTSIDESVHQTLKTTIERLGLDAYFEIQKRAILSYEGSEFFFAGISTDPAKFKSTEGIDILWVEEGESVTEESWRVISPTIYRNPFAEIWCSFNPGLPSDPTSKRFIVDPIPGARILQTNWRDNPYLPEQMLADKDYLARVDPDAFQHVWEGKFRLNSLAQIFANKYTIEAFDTPLEGYDGPYYGADWGFAVDPTTLVKLWVKDRKLFIEHEAYGIGVDLHKTADLFDRVPGGRNHVVRADNARPESISYMQQHGYHRITGVDKWPGSVEDGIAFLRSFEKIVIHPRCTHAADEALHYSYKQDRLSGAVLADVVDKHNHIWDAVRYALSPLIKRTGFGFIDFANMEMARMKAEKKAAQDKLNGR
jgi:phage terminase large subunit